jgi:hypothetical protein
MFLTKDPVAATMWHTGLDFSLAADRFMMVSRYGPVMVVLSALAC